MRARIALMAAALVALAGPAAASVMVLGDSLAADCSKAAFDGRSDRDSIILCSRSLDDESLARRDYPDSDPIGARIRMPWLGEEGYATIVGIAERTGLPRPSIIYNQCAGDN